MDFSLIVPCYNEAENVPRFFESVSKTFGEAELSYELIFIDDGSSDDTLFQLKYLIEKCKRSHPEVSLTAVRFTRNFGKEAALLAGLERSRGEFLGFIDADLQQDPATSLAMLNFLRQHDDFDAVAAVQDRRQESSALKVFKKAFYKVFNFLGDVDIPSDASDFRVFRRPVAQALIQMPEYFRFSKGMFAWTGFKTHLMPYVPRERVAGKSTWSFGKLCSYAVNGIVSFSTWPLKVTIYLGLLTAAAAILYLVYVLYEKAFMGIDVPGYPTLVCLILLFNGVLMLVLGIFGEYLARIYIEGKRRPLYIARESLSTDTLGVVLSGESFGTKEVVLSVATEQQTVTSAEVDAGSSGVVRGRGNKEGSTESSDGVVQKPIVR